MRQIVCSVLAIMAILALQAGANPLPFPTILEYSVQPPWIEILDYQLSVGDTIRTMEGIAIVGEYQANEEGIAILDSSNTSGFILNPQGDSISFAANYGSWPVLAYGLYGEPGLPPLPGESIKAGIHRINPSNPDAGWDIGYAFNPTPSPGQFDFENFDMIGGRWGTCPLIINEIAVHGAWGPNSNYIELYNRGTANISTDFLTLIGNVRYDLPPGITIHPGQRYTVRQTDLPPGFDLEPAADNLYLIDYDGNVLDQVGWSSEHGESVSFMRLPDGDVNPDSSYHFRGFDDQSSYTFEEGFPTRGGINRLDSPGLVVIGARGQGHDSTVYLEWTNPLWDSSYQTSVVVRSFEFCPTYPESGEILYEGTAEEFTDTGLIPRQPAYYTIFARNQSGEYSWPVSESMVQIVPGGWCEYVLGDVNGNGQFNGIDVVYLVRYFKGGPPPEIQCDCYPGGLIYPAADLNGTCSVNGIDVAYMVLILKGLAPMLNCPGCPPWDRIQDAELDDVNVR